MTGLEQTFYIMGIIFMSLTFLLILALVAAVLVIRIKINKIHDNIESKINSVSSLATSVVTNQAKKAFTKPKK